MLSEEFLSHYNPQSTPLDSTPKPTQKAKVVTPEQVEVEEIKPLLTYPKPYQK